MSKFPQGRQLYNGFADLSGKRAKKKEKRCANEECGIRLMDNRAVYCRVCSAARVAERERARLHRRHKRDYVPKHLRSKTNEPGNEST